MPTVAQKETQDVDKDASKSSYYAWVVRTNLRSEPNGRQGDGGADGDPTGFLMTWLAVSLARVPLLIYQVYGKKD